eukprot:505490_1
MTDIDQMLNLSTFGAIPSLSNVHSSFMSVSDTLGNSLLQILSILQKHETQLTALEDSISKKATKISENQKSIVGVRKDVKLAERDIKSINTVIAKNDKNQTQLLEESRSKTLEEQKSLSDNTDTAVASLRSSISEVSGQLGEIKMQMDAQFEVETEMRENVEEKINTEIHTIKERAEEVKETVSDNSDTSQKVEQKLKEISTNLASTKRAQEEFAVKQVSAGEKFEELESQHKRDIKSVRLQVAAEHTAAAEIQMKTSKQLSHLHENLFGFKSQLESTKEEIKAGKEVSAKLLDVASSQAEKQTMQSQGLLQTFERSLRRLEQDVDLHKSKISAEVESVEERLETGLASRDSEAKKTREDLTRHVIQVKRECVSEKSFLSHKFEVESHLKQSRHSLAAYTKSITTDVQQLGRSVDEFQKSVNQKVVHQSAQVSRLQKSIETKSTKEEVDELIDVLDAEFSRTSMRGVDIRRKIRVLSKKVHVEHVPRMKGGGYMVTARSPSVLDSDPSGDAYNAAVDYFDTIDGDGKPREAAPLFPSGKSVSMPRLPQRCLSSSQSPDRIGRHSVPALNLKDSGSDGFVVSASARHSQNYIRSQTDTPGSLRTRLPSASPRSNAKVTLEVSQSPDRPPDIYQLAPTISRLSKSPKYDNSTEIERPESEKHRKGQIPSDGVEILKIGEPSPPPGETVLIPIIPQIPVGERRKSKKN